MRDARETDDTAAERHRALCCFGALVYDHKSDALVSSMRRSLYREDEEDGAARPGREVAAAQPDPGEFGSAGI